MSDDTPGLEDKVRGFVKKVSDKVDAKTGELMDQELKKFDRPAWMGWTSHGVAAGLTLVAGIFLGSLRGVSTDEHEDALRALSTQRDTALTEAGEKYTKDTGELKAAIEKLKAERAAAVAAAAASAPAFDARRDAFLYKGSKVSMPARLLLGKSADEAKAALKSTGALAQVDSIGLGETVIWGTDNANIDGRLIIFENEEALQSDAGVKAVMKGLDAVRGDSAFYTSQRIGSLAYRFALASKKDGEGKETKVLNVVRDIGADNKVTPGYDSTTDMVPIATIALEQ